MSIKKGLVERLAAGEDIICAEGYLLELEARGYLKGGAYVPEVVLENGHLLRVLHEEFVHAGSDVVEALTFYLHRAKLRLIGREDDLEKINREALRIARQVAEDTGTLMAGNISNTLQYDPDKPETHQQIRSMYKEQLEWAVEGGADFIIGETFDTYGEAALGLECIQMYASGLPAVITITPQPDGLTFDGVPVPEACRRLEQAGAAVVGLNCWMGPETILPHMQKVRDVCKGPVACLPVPYRTTDDCRTLIQLKDKKSGKSAYHENLVAHHSSRTEICQLTRDLKKMGVQYMGLCCGGQAHFIRAMAETLGRKPPASRYSTDMEESIYARAEEDNVSFSRRHFLRKFGDVAAEVAGDSRD